MVTSVTSQICTYFEIIKEYLFYFCLTDLKLYITYIIYDIILLELLFNYSLLCTFPWIVVPCSFMYFFMQCYIE